MAGRVKVMRRPPAKPTQRSYTNTVYTPRACRLIASILDPVYGYHIDIATLTAMAATTYTPCRTACGPRTGYFARVNVISVPESLRSACISISQIPKAAKASATDSNVKGERHTWGGGIWRRDGTTRGTRHTAAMLSPSSCLPPFVACINTHVGRFTWIAYCATNAPSKSTSHVATHSFWHPVSHACDQSTALSTASNAQAAALAARRMNAL